MMQRKFREDGGGGGAGMVWGGKAVNGGGGGGGVYRISAIHALIRNRHPALGERCKKNPAQHTGHTQGGIQLDTGLYPLVDTERYPTGHGVLSYWT